jgi:hypothetical protein
MQEVEMKGLWFAASLSKKVNKNKVGLTGDACNLSNS